MNTVNTAVANMSEPRKLSPMDSFRKDAVAMEREFSRALPPHIPVERFMRVITTAVQTSMAANFTNLLECDRKSLWQAAIRAAQDGLLPDGREGAILKYGDKAQWLPMVAGIRKKARNSGEISTWDVHCVYKNDSFTLRLGDTPSIDHTYDLAKPRGELIGAYSVALLKDQSKSYEVMSIDEIRAIRDRSSAWQAFQARKIKSTPWGTDEGEMARKTVAKRHAKQLPSSADLDDLMRRDDELYEFDKTGEAENVTALPKRPRGKSALDEFAGEGKTIDGDPVTGEPEAPAAATPTVPAETVNPDTGEITDEPLPEFGAADAMELGREHFRQKKPRRAPPEWTDAGWADAYVEGWNEAAAESKGSEK